MILGGARHVSRALRRSRSLARLARLVRSERGVSIPEILVATIIAASVAGLLGTTVYQFFLITTDGRKRLTVQNNLRGASLWLGRDVPEAQTFTPDSGAVYGTLLSGDPSIKFRYSYNTGQKTLVREELLNDVVQSTVVAARDIASQGDIVFSASGSLLTVSITVTGPGGGPSGSETLKLAMRVR